MATWIVRRDICTSTNERPCGICADCRLFQEQHPNARIFDAALKDNLNVETIREQLHQFTWRPLERQRRRWLVILNAESAHEAVSNTLLKTIEEPAENLHIILTSSFPERLLSTIRSRAVAYQWHPVPQQTIEEYLRRRFPHLSVSELTAIVARSMNRPGLAVTLASAPALGEEESAAIDLLTQALQTRTISPKAEWTSTDLDIGERIVRDILMVKVEGSRLSWPERRPQWEELARHFSLSSLLRLAQRFHQRHRYLQQHVQPTFLLHDFLTF